MKLKPLASNMTELELNDTSILFSYKTPVAALIRNSDGKLELFKTDYKWSVTTSRHINKYAAIVDKDIAGTKPQEFFDNLISEVK